MGNRTRPPNPDNSCSSASLAGTERVAKVSKTKPGEARRHLRGGAVHHAGQAERCKIGEGQSVRGPRHRGPRRRDVGGDARADLKLRAEHVDVDGLIRAQPSARGCACAP